MEYPAYGESTDLIRSNNRLLMGWSRLRRSPSISAIENSRPQAGSGVPYVQRAEVGGHTVVGRGVLGGRQKVEERLSVE
jgi:hypothetical protein